MEKTWYENEAFIHLLDCIALSVAVIDHEGNILMSTNGFQNLLNSIGENVKTICQKEISLMRALKKEQMSVIFDKHFEALGRAHKVIIYALGNHQEDLYLLQIDDVSKERLAEQKMIDLNYEINEKNRQISDNQIRLINQEKMAGIGQLAAGIAHEINNPLGFVMSNFVSLDQYFKNLEHMILHIQKKLLQDKKDFTYEALEHLITTQKQNYDFDFLIEDYSELFRDTMDGLKRVEKIVSGLRIFSHKGMSEAMLEYDFNEGIEDALLITNNELKYDAEIIKDIQYVPLTLANRIEINQVIVNLLINAIHAIRANPKVDRGIIKITTRSDEQYITCEIMDNGCGIDPAIADQVFIPFFTTKEVGKGTGLGMSISYDIIVNKHGGDISFESEVGKGTTFKIKIPIKKVNHSYVNDYVDRY